MFNKKSFLSLSILVVLSLVLAACAPAATPEPTVVPTEEPTAAPQTIVDIAVADGRFKTLVAAVTAADLAKTLSGDGPFTVFAPTDDAFAKLPEGTVDALLNDIPALTDILLYHVVSGEVLAEDVVALAEAETLLGENVAIKVEDGMVYINDAQVIITDIVASNGVIHVIDTVLLPPAESLGTVVDIAIADGRFETLVAAVTAAGLAETLSGEGPFTVFAPTDDAFAKLPEGTVEALLNDIPALTDILLYHVVDGKVLAEDVVALREAQTLSGKYVDIRVEEGMVYLNDAQVVITDIMADNGVIHVIDTVLLPPESVGSIVDLAVADGRFTTLVAALQAAELVETLDSEEGRFTVFAPTDDAFAKLPAGTVEGLLEDIPALTEILLYHVVDGQYLASDVIILTEAETLNGGSVTIRIENGKVFINDAEVIITDIVADNGVIHVIDSVLLPAAE